VKPPGIIVWLLLAFCTAVLYWLVHVCFHIPLFKYLPAGSYKIIALHGGSLLFSFWTLRSLLELLKGPIQVPSKESWYFVAEALAETLVRKCHVLLGAGTPFHRESRRLAEQCRWQQMIWQRRCAERDYRQAMRRKRITGKSLNGLLLMMCSSTPEENDSITEGNADFFASEDFLDVQVVDDEEENAKPTFDQLTQTVMSFVQEFPIGARVEIQDDDDDDGDDGPDGDTFIGALFEIDNDSGAIVLRRSTIGSVVGSYPGIVVVHRDGESNPIPVRSALVTVIDASRMEDDVSVISIASEESIEEVYHDESEEKSQVDQDGVLVRPTARTRTVADALREGNWTWVRKKKHRIYKRTALSMDGTSRGETFTMACTPSDRRADKNALARLNRMNREAASSAPPAGPSLRRCSICWLPKSENCYSANQRKKAEEATKCKICIQIEQARERSHS
jgi:hypothetical protein